MKYFRDLPVEELAKTMKILSEPNRVKILCSMGLECTPVSALIGATGLSQTNVSFHLRVMREAGLIKGERRGAFVYYCLYDTTILSLLHDLNGWMQRSKTEANVA